MESLNNVIIEEKKQYNVEKFNSNLLKRYNKTPYDLKNEKYHYIGSDKNTHNFKLLFAGKPLPEHKCKCLCDHDIDENCYIINKNKCYDSIIIVGNVCRLRYMNNIGKKMLCEKCDVEHKNRSFNLCNDCIKSKIKVSKKYENIVNKFNLFIKCDVIFYKKKLLKRIIYAFKCNLKQHFKLI